MTKLWTWLKARWKGCLVVLGALGGLLLFWRARKPHLPWDDDPTPVDVMTPQEGVIRKQEIEAAAEVERSKIKARLEAERDGAETITFPSLVLEAADRPEVAAILTGERSLFELRRQSRQGQTQQLRQRST